MAIFKLADQLALEGLTLVAKTLQSICLGDVGANHSLFACHDFLHLLFDFWEIGACDDVFTWVDIVVETVFDGWTDTELNTVVEFLKSFCQQVS